MLKRFNSFVLLLLLFMASPAWADNLPSMPANYVVDLANIIDEPTERELNGYLNELEEKTTAQFIVLTVNSLDDMSIESFSLQAAEKWRLGQKGKDNGLLLTISLEDKKYRFEVGYGLESTLPDSLVGSVGRSHLVPRFRNKEFSRGIRDTVLATIGYIAKDNNVTITGMPSVMGYKVTNPPKLAPVQRAAPTPRHRRSASDILIIVLFGGFLLWVLKTMLFHPFFKGGKGGSGGGRYWHGGGSGYGGGFSGGGGFGGGGGGGFGGGGASGGW